ncbi:FKBP-type peptidyl-prolyl cis-trans isomerase [Gemmatimonas sp.]|uniref:FKBP-type peptidyl-prolyl cis-trans isomerase n=1 Tax=Gemmatimonas sp. TaxID=1962908 RepID=UPI0039839A57
MRRLLWAAIVVGVTGCAGAPRFAVPIPPVEGKAVPLFSLSAIDLAVGAGTALTAGRCVYAHYTGWTTDGKKFDSSRDTTNAGRAKDPISFPQGFRRVIAGWDLGFQGMNVGGSRRLVIPWQLAYGEKGRPPAIPGKATLIFDVELMHVADTIPRADGSPRPAGQAPSCPTWSAVQPVQAPTFRE